MSGVAPTEEEKIPEEPVEEEIPPAGARPARSPRSGPAKDVPEKEEPTIAWTTFASQAKEVLEPNEYLLLAQIAQAIGKDGMTPQEACMLVNLPYESFQALAKKHPIIEKIVALKELEYKRTLLRALAKKARGGDDDVAKYLLENRYPGEFGKKRATDPGGDLLKEAIDFIQSNGDSTPVVRDASPASQLPRTIQSPDVVEGHEAAKELQQFLV